MAKKKEPTPTEYPWERQPGEGTKAYEAFNTYMMMGTPNPKDRSYTKVAAQLNKSSTIIGRWGGLYNWQERVAAWDAQQLENARQDQLEEIKKMRQRHAHIATSMLAKVSKRMLKMTEEELTPQDIKAWVDVASKLERLSRGDTSEVVEERDGGAAINPVQIYIPNNGREDEEE